MRNPFARHYARQRASITREYIDKGSSLTAVTHGKLRELADDNEWTTTALAGTRGNNALVVTKVSGAFAELWVRHTYTGYRRAFGRFLAAYHGFATDEIPLDWHVDHLCSRLLFRGGRSDVYVRLILIPASFNTSFGGGYEKLLYTRERERDARDAYYLSYITFLKVRGVKLPSSTADPSAWATWAEQTAQALARRGLDDLEQAYDGMTMMLGLAYRGTWKPLPHTPKVADVVDERERTWAAIPKVFVLTAQGMFGPLEQLGTFPSMIEAKRAAHQRAPRLWWKHRDTGEHSAWDESVRPHVEYSVRPVPAESVGQ